jgi:hypothetical protein
MDNIWFNEDDDRVYGVKSTFKDEEEFIKEANKLHVEMIGCSCTVDNIQTDVFINVLEPLEAEMMYSLKDTKVGFGYKKTSNPSASFS